jgi:hypothetical protein
MLMTGLSYLSLGHLPGATHSHYEANSVFSMAASSAKAKSMAIVSKTILLRSPVLFYKFVVIPSQQIV